MTNILIKDFVLTSPRVLREHSGIKIAHLSDLHARRNGFLHEVVQRLNSIKPHVVVLTGDYVCYSKKVLPYLSEVLSKVECQYKICVLGNHDHWLSAYRVSNALRDGGCTVLHNESITLNFAGKPLQIIGIDDRITKRDDPTAAYAGLPADGTRIALTLVPEVSDCIAPYNNALVLSGHTHGGQILIPWLTKYIHKQKGLKYMSGLFVDGDQVLYVSSGIGAVVPFRFLTYPEIACFTLKQGEITCVK